MRYLQLAVLAAAVACSAPFGGDSFRVRMVFAPGFPFVDGTGICSLKWRLVASDSGQANPRHVTWSINDGVDSWGDASFTEVYPTPDNLNLGWVYTSGIRGHRLSWSFEAGPYLSQESRNIC